MFSVQWRLLKRDPWLQTCLLWVPIFLAIILWWIFSAAIVRSLPVGVVDLSHSELSRSFTRDLNATSTLSVIRVYPSQAQAKADLIQSHIYAYTVIPYGFDRDVQLHRQPQITTFYNSQYILTGKLVNSAVALVQNTFNAKLSVANQLVSGQQTFTSALGKAVPIQTQMTALFNLNMNYAQFLVSGIIPALWQIVIVASTILILSTWHRNSGLSLWLGNTPYTNLLRTLTPYCLLFALQGAGYLWFFYSFLDWPQHGQLTVLLIAQWLTILACVIVGVMIYFLTLDAARSLSFAAAYTAPSFAFMGITFPATNMGSLATFWRDLLPISHYINVQINQTNYGLGIVESLKPMGYMVIYLVPLLIGLGLIHWRTQQNTAHGSQRHD
ncbi:ABC transporter permease [Vibrio nitrifigilis]|uniref:ABC transporter permease n=1 Tax=Vibrio nitrifigilis TaxID=2789781 RepID=A0ABS0GCP9_9VIBR|nr:ABC transporter permease [Vibrio nitrifigilis]MBF9000191.1 ABC transporter permease [Vibrio nitrifigilis]